LTETGQPGQSSRVTATQPDNPQAELEEIFDVLLHEAASNATEAILQQSPELKENYEAIYDAEVSKLAADPERFRGVCDHLEPDEIAAALEWLSRFEYTPTILKTSKEQIADRIEAAQTLLGEAARLASALGGWFGPSADIGSVQDEVKALGLRIQQVPDPGKPVKH
jgi:hypothetical protein